MRVRVTEIGRDRDKQRVWQVDVDDRPQFRERFRVHGKRSDVDDAVARIVTEHQRGGVLVSRKLTVGQLLDEWLAQHVAGLATQTDSGYRSIVKHHLRDYFGEVAARDMRQTLLNDYNRDKLATGLARNTVHRHGRALISCLLWAARQEYISAAIPARLRALPRDSEERKALDLSDLVALLASMKGLACYLPGMLAATRGLRSGEVCGLRWKDVDMAGRRISVDMTMQRDRQRKKPKTKRSRRVLAMPEVLHAALTEHRAAVVARFGQWAVAGDEPVVITQDGRTYLPSTLSSSWHRVASVRGYPDVRFHDLRHTFASMAIADGATVVDVAAMLGHSSPNITLGIYAHAFESAAERSAARVDEAWQKARPKVVELERQ